MSTDTPTRQIGDLLDQRGVILTMPTDDLISDVVLVAKVHGDHGVYIKTAWTDGTDWITRRALLEIAATEEANMQLQPDDEEDDE